MWIGSKVPPRIPIRTVARIGSRRRHKPERPADIGLTTPQLANRIHVPPPDPGRQVHRLLPMGPAREANTLPASHHFATPHVDRSQIRDGHFEIGDGLDGHRSHAGHLPCKRDTTANRRSHFGMWHCSEIDTPMSAVLAHRGEPRSYRTADRWAEAHRQHRKNRQHRGSNVTKLDDGF